MSRIEISSIEIQPIDRTTCNVRLELSFNDGSWNTFKNKSFIHYSNEIYSNSANDYQDDDFSGVDNHHVIKEIMIEESNFNNKSITISDFNVFYKDSTSNYGSDDKTKSWNTYAFNTIHIPSGNLPETSPVHQVEVYGTLHQPEISSVDKLKNAYVLKVKVNSHSESRLEGFLVTIGGAIFTDLSGIDAIDISYDSLLDDGNFEEYKIKSYYVPKSDVADTRTTAGDNSFYDIRVCDPSYAISDISKGQVNRMVFNEVDNSTLHFTKFLTENSVSLIDVSNHQTLESNSVEANGNSSINTFNNVRAYTGDAGKISTLADGTLVTGYQDNSGNTTDLMQYINYDSSGVASYGAIKIYADAPSEMLSNYPYEARLFWIQDPSGGISTNDAATYLKDRYTAVSDSTSTSLKDKISSDWTCVDNITDISNGFDISGLNDGKPVYFFIQSYDTINNRYTRVDFLKNIGKITPHAPPPRITSASPSIHGTSLTDSSQNDPLYQNSGSIHVDFSLNEHYNHTKVGDLTSIMVLFEDILVNEYDISDVVTDMNNNHQGSDLSASIAYRLNLENNNDTHSSPNVGADHYSVSRNQPRALNTADLSLGFAFTTEYFPFTLSPSDVSFSDDVNIQLREQPAVLSGVSFEVIHGTGGNKGRVKVSATGATGGDPIPVQILIEDPTSSNKLFYNDSVNISNAGTGTNWYVFDASMTNSSGGVYDVSFESPYDNQEFKYQVARTTSSYKLNNSINNDTVIPDDLSRNTNGVADLFTDLSWSPAEALTTKHAPTHDISINSSPTEGNSNDISSVTLTIIETARNPAGLGDTSANTFLVLYPVNNAGNPDLQDLSFALSDISGRDASLNDASTDISRSYTVTFDVGDISYGQVFKLLFTNDVSGSTGVNTGKLYTRYAPNPPTLNWKEYSSSSSPDASGNDWETPKTIKYLEITLPNADAGNYGGDPSYSNANYVYNIDVSGNGQTHTTSIKHNQITSTTGVFQAHNGDNSIYMPASEGQPIYLQFTDLSENTNYNFNVTLKSVETDFVSDPADISASTDITLTNFDDGDFALDLTINKNIATDSDYTDINVEECTLDVSFTFSGDGVNDGTNVYGYYIIANISGQPFVILSKDLSDQTVSSRNSFNDSHTFDVNNPFGNDGASSSLPGLLMPTLTDISDFDVTNGHIINLKDQNDISGELNYPRYGIDISYSVRVAFIDQDNNKYTNASYNPSSGINNALAAEADVGSTILSSFPIITNVKVDLSNNKILKLDISLNQQGEKITHFMILSPNTDGNKMHHDLTTHVNTYNYPLFGNHHYQTEDLNLHTDNGDNKDIILFIQNDNGANLYYLDNFVHNTNHHNESTRLNHLNKA